MATCSTLSLIGLAVALALASLYSREDQRRLIMCAILLGYLAGGALAWAATPGAWRLSFPETMAASVNAIRYGHPVEHYAQGIIVMMLVAAQLGALLCGSLAGLFGRLTRRSAANTA